MFQFTDTKYFCVENWTISVSVDLIEVWEELNYPKGEAPVEGTQSYQAFHSNIFMCICICICIYYCKTCRGGGGSKGLGQSPKNLIHGKKKKKKSMTCKSFSDDKKL